MASALLSIRLLRPPLASSQWRRLRWSFVIRRHANVSRVFPSTRAASKVFPSLRARIQVFPSLRAHPGFPVIASGIPEFFRHRQSFFVIASAAKQSKKLMHSCNHWSLRYHALKYSTIIRLLRPPLASSQWRRLRWFFVMRRHYQCIVHLRVLAGAFRVSPVIASGIQSFSSLRAQRSSLKINAFPCNHWSLRYHALKYSTTIRLLRLPLASSQWRRLRWFFVISAIPSTFRFSVIASGIQSFPVIAGAHPCFPVIASAAKQSKKWFKLSILQQLYVVIQVLPRWIHT